MPCARSGRRTWRRSSAMPRRSSRSKAVPHDTAPQAPHEASARELQVFPASPAAPSARANRPEPDRAASPVVGVLAAPMTALTVVSDAEIAGADTDEHLIERAHELLTPVELTAFRRLYEYGEVTERSPSEGDWKLLCLICQMTRDPAQAERLARSSVLASSAEMWAM